MSERLLRQLSVCAIVVFTGACNSTYIPSNHTGSGGRKSTGGTSATEAGSSGDTSLGGEPSTDAGGTSSTDAGGTSSTTDVAGGGTEASAGGAPQAGAGGTTATGAAGASSSTAGASNVAGAGNAVRWLGTWTASPYYDGNNQPPVALSSSVLRQVAHVSLGGSRIRVQFSNLFGNGPVTINSAHIALCKATPAVDSTIDPTTDKALTFSGAASVTIASAKEIWSDPIDFAVPNRGNISITTAFGSVPTQVVGHSGSRTTSYIQASSSDVSAASMTAATKTDHWYYISGIDVDAATPARAIVAIGDSLTDGRGTDTNYNNRWTDNLAARLLANAATADVAIMNQGIGATGLVGNYGNAAQGRFARDVIGQSGVRYAIIFDGVNDINGNQSSANMKAAYDALISVGHSYGLLVYGATITPFYGNNYYDTAGAHEAVRQEVNAYIRSGVFDGYLDFDAAVTDGGTPPKLQSAYATWAQTDWLHLSPAGYQKLADSVDLTLFTK